MIDYDQLASVLKVRMGTASRKLNGLVWGTKIYMNQNSVILSERSGKQML